VRAVTEIEKDVVGFLTMQGRCCITPA